jgi:ketosteroid isomerase-like protein
MDETVETDAATMVRDFYAKLLNEKTFSQALAMMAPDFIVSSPPSLPWGGVHHGVDGFMTMVHHLMSLATLGDDGEMEFIEGGDQVVVRSKRGRLTSIASGTQVSTSIVEIVQVHAGKLVELDIYYKDPGAVAAIFS